MTAVQLDRQIFKSTHNKRSFCCFVDLQKEFDIATSLAYAKVSILYLPPTLNVMQISENVKHLALFVPTCYLPKPAIISGKTSNLAGNGASK